MTTAHRPTWKAAVGRANEGGWTAGGAASAQVSTLDAPAHLTLKTRRADGGDKKAALKKSLLALQEAAAESADGANKNKKHHHVWKRTMDPAVEERGRQRLLKQSAEVDVLKIKEQYDDADIDGGKGGESDDSSDLDKKEDDDPDLDVDDDSGGSSSSSDDGGDDDDEDDEAALQAELAKIRAEREQARLRAEERAAKEENARQEESALLGNPLLAAEGGGMAGLGNKTTTKRRWNDDVVFRNQAKGEPSAKKRFINDTVRNDFHKRFLNKFIR
jgi:protein CWC15